MDCHFPHKSGVTYNAPTTPNAGSGRYLLSFQEESSCYNNPGDRWGTPGSASACHGSGSAGTKRDVQDETGGGGVSGKTSAHHVGSYTNFHNATEGRTYSWLGNWHVECQDCHNPHTAGNSLHTAGTNTISPSGVLYGAGGVNMGSWPAAWNPPTAINYNYIEPIGLINQTPTTPLTYEYEICFKCHSSFSWGAGAKPTTSTGTLLTDQAMEYNPSNASYHAVAGPSKLPAGRGTYVNGWTATSTITCSDCHGNDVASPAPQGPHGSINTPILKKAYTDNYSTVLSQTQPTTDLCFDCHDVSAYETGPAVPGSQVTGFYTTAGTNLHTRHYILSTSSATGLYAYRCVNCHAKIPHGYNRKALIVVQNEGAPYEAGGTGQGKITNALLATAGTYSTYKTTPDCTTVVGCHN